MKNYFAFIRDHSGSMARIARAAAKDYNVNVAAIKENTIKHSQDTIITVIKCGVGDRGLVVREVTNSSVITLQPLNESDYKADGGSTPLFDSVGSAIEAFEALPDANDPGVSFVIQATTDGIDNASVKWKYTLGKKIAQLQATDRWTFAFRVPRPDFYTNYKESLVRMGVPTGNIYEWDQTDAGVEVATKASTQAYEQYYTARARGETSTKNFYTTDASQLNVRTVKSKLIDITDQVEFIDVTKADNGKQIRAFVQSKRVSGVMGRGAAFYQLTKTESEVQDHKQIAIRDKKSRKVYSGAEARTMLGLPYNGTVKVVPGNHGAYDIFIQSTSVNRKLVAGTQVLYWEKVGVAFQS